MMLNSIDRSDIGNSFDCHLRSLLDRRLSLLGALHDKTTLQVDGQTDQGQGDQCEERLLPGENETDDHSNHKSGHGLEHCAHTSSGCLE